MLNANPFILAHRGYTKSAPENSIAAMRAAFEAGFDGIECDIQVTADHVPCIHHDDSIDRMTEGEGSISALLWANVREQRLKTSKECIPSLIELLDVTRSFTLVNLEIKCPLALSPFVFKELAQEFNERPARADQIVLTSFDETVVTACAEAFPFVRRGLLLDKKTTSFLKSAMACNATVILPHVSAVNEAISYADSEGQNPFSWWTWSASSLADLKVLSTNSRLEAIISDCPSE